MQIQDTGINQGKGSEVRLKPSKSEDLTLIQKGNHLQVLAEFTFDTDRKIKGCAHFPAVDRENELILSDAIRKALPQYMQHPILHVQHTERPVGTLTKAEIDAEGALQIEGTIFDTPDTNDVWADIQKGILNKFSIFGRRDSGSYECALSPDQRTSPCVTKALTLFSISIVGENAMNTRTFLEVAKGMKGDTTEDTTEDKEDVEKCAPACKKSDDLIHEPSNTSQMLGRIDGVEKANGEFGDRLAKIEETLSQLVESDKKVHDTMDKAEDEELTEEKKEEVVEKAAPVEKPAEPAPEYIVKASLDSEIKKAVDEVKKAYDEKFASIEKAHADLSKVVESMKKETIEKGGHVVIIKKEALDANPKMGHLDMIGDVA